MKSLQRGRSTSRVEVQGVSNHGIWLYAGGEEHFLPYKKYPFFFVCNSVTGHKNSIVARVS